jgi:hypothetical protein
VFEFERRLSRALRILLACAALVTAMPSAHAAAHDPFSLAITAVEHCDSLPRAACERARRTPRVTSPARYHEQELIRAKHHVSEPPLRTRAIFALNCRWLC